MFFDTDAIHQTNPSSISMRWDWRNLTANANSYVNITLWGYRETTIRPELVLIDILQVQSLSFEIISEWSGLNISELAKLRFSWKRFSFKRKQILHNYIVLCLIN